MLFAVLASCANAWWTCLNVDTDGNTYHFKVCDDYDVKRVICRNASRYVAPKRFPKEACVNDSVALLLETQMKLDEQAAINRNLTAKHAIAESVPSAPVINSVWIVIVSGCVVIITLLLVKFNGKQTCNDGIVILPIPPIANTRTPSLVQCGDDVVAPDAETTMKEAIVAKTATASMPPPRSPPKTPPKTTRHTRPSTEPTQEQPRWK